MTGTDARRSPFNEGLVLALAAVFGLCTMKPLHDNSGFTHLATGIQMVAHGWVPAIPRVDHYSYSAFGHAWVVQSWVPSYVVGGLDRAFGLHAVVLLAGGAAAAVALITAFLARTGSAARTAAAVAVGLAIGAPSWAPRPLMAGLLCFGAMALVVRHRRAVAWLVPIAWVWVQSHGTFPLGALFLATLAAGAWLDSGRRISAVRYELQALAALVGGILLGAVNPLGPKLVLFPLTALSKREVFRHIVEWKPLDFASLSGICAFIGIAVALAACVRYRASWRIALPLIVFVALGVSAQRNATVLALVAAFGLGELLRVENPAQRTTVNPLAAVALSVVSVIVVASTLSTPALQLDAYPVAAIRWAEAHNQFDAPNRLLAPDFVGNYIELRHGPSRDVFIDDRYDMYPLSVSRDYFTLFKGVRPAAPILDRWHITSVLWERNEPLVTQLRSAGWRIVYADRGIEKWVVLVRP